MAERYGGKYSPLRSNQIGAAKPRHRNAYRGRAAARGRARVNLMFVAPLPLLIRAFGGGAFAFSINLIAFAALILSAWLLREGLKAEAAFNARDVARRPAFPRKFIASELTGVGVALATFNPEYSIVGPIVYGMIATVLQLVAFGLDPVRDKVATTPEGKIDKVATERVARVVDESEAYLSAMDSAIKRLGDRYLTARVEEFQTTAREMFRAVERDPRDLNAARKYMTVYLMGARDAARKFADLFERNRNSKDRSDFVALLDDLEANFEARTQVLLNDNRTDLEIEIEVLRERLSREGVRTEP